MPVDMEWVTVSEAARRLGVTRQAIRGRIARKTIPCQHDNHGHPMVMAVAPVPFPVCSGTGDNSPVTVPLRAVVTAPTAETRPLPTAAPPDRTGLVSLDDVRLLLGEQREAMERQHRDAMQMATERIDAAEVRAERLENHLLRLLEDRRPFWTRWFGKSKTSDL